jgi:hypothetical protein
MMSLKESVKNVAIISAIPGLANVTMTASYAHATQHSKRSAVAILEGKIKKLGHQVPHRQATEKHSAASNRGVNG